jgi:ubiquinone biosynthesis protein
VVSVVSMVEGLFLDIQRALLLFRVSLKHGAGPLIRHLLRLSPRGDRAVRVRLAMEELGLTYLKLGQFLALRFDILPPEVNRELNKLFERVPPIPYKAVETVIEAELGGPIHDFFPVFDEEPIASASVAQVHIAETTTGERVAVKVQRPGILRIFSADMRNLRRITRLVDALGLLGNLSATEMTDEFIRWTLREMDFITEGRTADAVRADAASYEIIPRVNWDLTTSKLLTMEYIDGISMAEVSNILDEGGLELLREYLPNLQLETVLHHLVFASLRQLFVAGLFHGDPHPGNILVRDDSTVAFVDFGIFGSLTEYEQEALIGLLENISVGNINASFRYYSLQLTPTDETDPRSFEREAKHVLRRWYQASVNPDSPVEERHVGRYIVEMIEVSRRNHLRFGRDYLLSWRTLNALDATLLRLPVDFDFMVDLRTFFEQNRPQLIERVLTLAAERKPVVTFTELARETSGRFGGILRDLAGGHYASRHYMHEATASQRANNDHTRWLVASLVAVSLAVLAAYAFT